MLENPAPARAAAISNAWRRPSIIDLDIHPALQDADNVPVGLAVAGDTHLRRPSATGKSRGTTSAARYPDEGLNLTRELRNTSG
jgi:hypothetical protein